LSITVGEIFQGEKMKKEIDQKLKNALISFAYGKEKLSKEHADLLDKNEELQLFIEEIFATQFTPFQKLIKIFKNNF
jgi:altronate dehydratase